MPRRNNKRSNVTAAIDGSKEVAAELMGDTNSANRYGTREKAARGGGSPRSRTSSPSNIDRGGKRQAFNHLEIAGTYTIPSVVKRDLYTGRADTTDFLMERDFTSRPAVYIYPYWGATWSFQSGTTTLDAQANVLGTYVTNMFNDILRTLQGQRLVNISNVALANPTPAPVYALPYVPSSMQALLLTFCSAAVMVRTLESLLVAGDFNFAMSRISDAVMQNLQQLEAVSRKLRGFRIPPLLIELIDRVSGVKIIDAYSPAMVYGGLTLSTGLQSDLTVPANVLTMITTADTFLTQCVNPGFNGGAGANLAGDFQLIWSLFADAYGFSGTWPAKGVSKDIGEYYQGYTSAIQWGDTTLAKWFGVPNTAAVDVVPTLIPKTCSPETAKFLLSLMGYQKYTPELGGVVGIAVPANFVGLFSMNIGSTAVTGATSLVFYSQNATYTNSPQQGGAARTINWQNSETSAFYFASPADQEVINATMYTNDQRYNDDMDIIKSRRVDLIDATQKRLEEIFVLSVL